MQEARSIPDRYSAVGCVAQFSPQFLKLAINLRCFFNVIQERDVIAGLDRRQVSSYDFSDRLCLGSIVVAIDGNEIVSSDLISLIQMTTPFKRAQYFLRRV